MKTKIVLFFALAVGFLTAASVQAVPITYTYTGNTFTTVTDPDYTTSDSVSGMLTLASPLAANSPLSLVTPTSFSFTDGVQLISTTVDNIVSIQVGTGPTGEIIIWNIHLFSIPGVIDTINTGSTVHDLGSDFPGFFGE